MGATILWAGDPGLYKELAKHELDEAEFLYDFCFNLLLEFLSCCLPMIGCDLEIEVKSHFLP